MKNYRFYNFEGDSVNVFDIPKPRDSNIEYMVGYFVQLLNRGEITGIEYDFLINAVDYVEIDKTGKKIERDFFSDWLENNKGTLVSMVMRNQFTAVEKIARAAFDAGKLAARS